jgi:DNA-directed RNA polymerase specialized sigma24 family protein
MADPTELSTARLLELHAAVIRGDPAAIEQIWVALWRPLRRWLQRKFRVASADLIEDAANDAIRAYVTNPHAFDPARQERLDLFVYGIGNRKLRDRLRKEKREAVRESEYATVQQAQASAAEDRLISRILAREVRSALPLVCTRIELAAFEAHLADTDTPVVAALLGLPSLPLAEQRHAEKGLRDAVIKRLKHRLLGGGGFTPKMG